MKVRSVVVGVLALALVGAWAQAQENEGRPGPGGQPRPGPEGRPGVRPAPPGGPGAMLGMDIPAVREEMKRHVEEMRNIQTANRDIEQAVINEVRPLREKGAKPEEIQEATKKFAPQAEAAAKKVAAELATHYENLAKIFKEKQDEVVKQLAESLVRRIATREPRRGAGPGGPGPEGGDRPPRPRPDDRGGAAPGNF